DRARGRRRPGPAARRIAHHRAGPPATGGQHRRRRARHGQRGPVPPPAGGAAGRVAAGPRVADGVRRGPHPRSRRRLPGPAFVARRLPSRFRHLPAAAPRGEAAPHGARCRGGPARDQRRRPPRRGALRAGARGARQRRHGLRRHARALPAQPGPHVAQPGPGGDDPGLRVVDSDRNGAAARADDERDACRHEGRAGRLPQPAGGGARRLRLPRQRSEAPRHGAEPAPLVPARRGDGAGAADPARRGDGALARPDAARPAGRGGAYPWTGGSSGCGSTAVANQL
ncbi:MAG: tRNA (cytidine(32)/uridine(32)-2'-O)-methyltransferase, partial [uncultured Acetobacteraceae bacterium]